MNPKLPTGPRSNLLAKEIKVSYPRRPTLYGKIFTRILPVIALSGV